MHDMQFSVEPFRERQGALGNLLGFLGEVQCQHDATIGCHVASQGDFRRRYTDSKHRSSLEIAILTWIIIVLVLLVAFGPVFWLMPSQRDRLLSALRQKARMEGLVVELRRVPKLNPEPEERVSAGGKIRKPVIDCAAYLWNMADKLRFLPDVRILRGTNGTPMIPGWVLDPERKPRRDHLDVLLNTLANHTEKLPEDVIGIEVSERQVVCYWLESSGSGLALVTEIAARLQRLGDDLHEVDERLKEDYLGPDS